MSDIAAAASAPAATASPADTASPPAAPTPPKPKPWERAALPGASSAPQPPAAAAASTTQSAEAKAPAPPADQLIKQAVSFINNPRVKHTSVEQKRAFLNGKGLSEAQVDEAFRLAAASKAASPPAQPHEASGAAAAPATTTTAAAPATTTTTTAVAEAAPTAPAAVQPPSESSGGWVLPVVYGAACTLVGAALNSGPARAWMGIGSSKAAAEKEHREQLEAAVEDNKRQLDDLQASPR